MRFETVLVTPQKAQDWLSLNKGNRQMRKKVVLQYATEMRDGRWREDTGETIKFDPSGNLLDGQHRLAAVVKAGTPVNMSVVYDVPSESFKVIDTGLKRGTSDVFFIGNIPYNTVLPTILRYYKNYKAGTMGMIRSAMSSSVLLDMYNERPVFWQECAKHAERWHKAFKPITPSAWGFLGAVLVEMNNDEAMDFLDKLASGRGIEHDGMYNLRDKFVSESVSTARTPVEYRLAMVIKLWNSIRSGKPIKTPKYDPFNEDYPKAI